LLFGGRTVRRAIIIDFIVVLLLLSFSGFAAEQKKKERKPFPPVMWEVKAGRVRYYLIPYDAVSVSGHEKIREQIPGFIFFFVIVDNKSKDEVEFRYGGNDIGFVRKDGGRYGNVDLRNTFKDPAQASKITPEVKAMFKNLRVKPGKKDWTLVCFRESLKLEDIRTVFWSLPGEPMPKNVTDKRKPVKTTLIRKLKIPYIK